MGSVVNIRREEYHPTLVDAMKIHNTGMLAITNNPRPLIRLTERKSQGYQLSFGTGTKIENFKVDFQYPILPHEGITPIKILEAEAEAFGEYAKKITLIRENEVIRQGENLND
jgi:hypothetical protein